MPSTSTHLLVPNVPFQTGLVLGLLEKAEMEFSDGETG